MTHDAAPDGAPIFQTACSTNIPPLTGLGLANQNRGGDVSSDVSSPPSPQNARHILIAFLLASWRLRVSFRPNPKLSYAQSAGAKTISNHAKTPRRQDESGTGTGAGTEAKKAGGPSMIMRVLSGSSVRRPKTFFQTRVAL